MHHPLSSRFSRLACCPVSLMLRSFTTLRYDFLWPRPPCLPSAERTAAIPFLILNTEKFLLDGNKEVGVSQVKSCCISSAVLLCWEVRNGTTKL